MLRAASARRPPWQKASPKKKAGMAHKLTPAQKSVAKAAARQAGRRYPNLVDNMRAAAKARRRPTQ